MSPLGQLLMSGVPGPVLDAETAATISRRTSEGVGIFPSLCGECAAAIKADFHAPPKMHPAWRAAALE